MSKNLNIWIIIPAYNPNYKLVELIENLYKYNKNILVINDGSSKESNKYFEKIKEKCIILNSSENKGKGNALKKGFKYIVENEKSFIGVVTVDADGQHQIEDIIKIENEIKDNPKKIILGYRDFDKENVPFLNKISNKMMCFLNKKIYGYNIKDTQTGLRGIPRSYLKEFINIYGERYEYEYNVLKYIQLKNIEFCQIAINTIYDKKIKSNYKKIIDSIKILKIFLSKKQI